MKDKTELDSGKAALESVVIFHLFIIKLFFFFDYLCNPSYYNDHSVTDDDYCFRLTVNIWAASFVVYAFH